MRESFVASGEVDHFDLIARTWICHLRSRKESIYGDVDLDDFELLSHSAQCGTLRKASLSG